MSEAKSESAKVAAIIGAEGERVVVKIDGKSNEFTVAPLMAWQILEALKCIEALSEAGVVELGSGSKSFNAYKIVTRGGEDGLRMLAVAVTSEEDEEKIKQSVALLRRANFVELSRLCGKVVKSNYDFFTQNQDMVLEAFGVTPEQLEGAKKKLASIKLLLNYLVEASHSVKSGAIPSPKLSASSAASTEETVPSSSAPSSPSS